MKKKLLPILLSLVLLLALAPGALAVDDGYVTFTSSGTMQEQNFNVDQLFDDIEPGDTKSYTVHLKNENSRTTRWYMSNEVLTALETSGASGGAYTYRLIYTGPSGTASTLYDSSHVGGDNGANGRVGLREATTNLENFFYLDTLNSGESGTVVLTVGLEGETLGNSYRDTKARIRMNFAVELANATTGSTSRAVQTGDDTNLVPYYIGMGVAGMLLLYLALDAWTDRLFQKGRHSR